MESPGPAGRQQGFGRWIPPEFACIITQVTAKSGCSVDAARTIRWKEGDSALQREDLVVLLEHAADMDLAYLESWAARLGVGPQLEELLG